MTPSITLREATPPLSAFPAYGEISGSAQTTTTDGPFLFGGKDQGLHFVSRRKERLLNAEVGIENTPIPLTKGLNLPQRASHEFVPQARPSPLSYGAQKDF